MSKVKHVLFLILLAACAVSARAETVALALSGGGARGFAHIGVLQALEEEGLTPDLIVGSSMGAVVGGLYSAGYSSRDLKSIAINTDWSSLFLDRPARRNLFLARKETSARHILNLRFRGWVPEVPLAISTGQRLTEFLFNLIQVAPYGAWPSFNDLKIPFRAVATDLVSGQPVIFKSGDLSEAMRASISLPLVFSPYRLDTLLLVDGGVIENIPVEISRQQGADVVIAVDLSTGMDVSGNVEAPWELADRVTTIMHRDRNAESIKSADVVLAPEIGTHKSTDFTDVPALIEAGYRAARAKMPELKAAFARSSHPDNTADFCSHSVLQRFRAATPSDSLPPVHYALNGVSLVSDETIYALPKGPDGLSRLDLLRRTYLDGGHTLAHATSLELTPDRTLRSHWEEGRVRTISVQGLKRYRPETLLIEFPIRTGDAFDLARARRGTSQIYGSDLFETVNLSVVPSDSGADITIRATERPSPQLRFGAGFSIERKGRGFIEFLNDNLLDLGARLALFGKYGELDEAARADVTFDRFPLSTPWDRALESYLTTEIRGAWSREDNFAYNLNHKTTGSYHFERTSTEVWGGRAFRRWGELMWGGRYEDFRSGGVADQPTGHATTVGVRTLIDTKDSYPFPNSGFGLSGRYEYAIKNLSQRRAFNRVTATADGFVPVRHRLVLHARGDYAWNDRDLPLWAQYPLGGEESLLGLHQAEILGNVRTAFFGELRYDLISKWAADAYISAEYTVGAVTSHAQTLPDSRDYQHGVGIALALSTFLGPMKLTAAELLPSERYSREHFQIYLNLGHQF